MAEKKVEPLGRRLIVLAVVLCLGAVAPLLDTTIVNVALHTLGVDMHASVQLIQWVSTGYLLALAMTLPITAWATERFGGKRMWQLALVVFTLGSVMSGLSWNLQSLIAFRILQGVGAGLIQPIMQTILVRAAGPHRIGRLLTIVTILAVVAPIFGPVVGGAILANASWRWIFFVNVPLCLAAFIFAWILFPSDEITHVRRLDLKGLSLLSPAVVGIVYGLSESASQGGFAAPQVLLPLGLGVVLLVWFIVRAVRATPDPLLDIRLFRVPSFAASSSVLFLSGLSLYGALLLLPLFYQQVHGQDALAAGLLLAPQGVGALLTRWVGGLIDRIGARPIVLAGMVLAALGTVPYALAGPDASELVLALSLVVRGAGLGAANVAIVTGAFQGIPRAQIPDASSIIRLLQQLGGSFGTAVLAVILASQLTSRTTTTAGMASAFNITFIWSIGFTVLAIIPAMFMAKKRAPENAGGTQDA